MRLVIKSGRVMDPANGVDTETDISIENGRISSVAQNIDTTGAEVLDAKGLVVAPGFIETEMTAELPAEIREGILEQVPLGRMGTAEEVAEVVAWLATRAHYVHGTVIHVNGGMYGG